LFRAVLGVRFSMGRFVLNVTENVVVNLNVFFYVEPRNERIFLKL
jgi:hypothetical protein